MGIYTVTVSNLAASVTSASAALRVNQTVTTFFDDFETYSITSPVGYGRGGTPLDYNYGATHHQYRRLLSLVGAIAAQFLYFVSSQIPLTGGQPIPAYSGSQMIGGAYDSVSVSGDNDETFLNLAYRFNGGQIYYGDIMLDYYFYDPGTPDAGDQISLANFASRMPATSDSSGFQIPASPVQNLFIGTWPNLNTNLYQAGVMGAADGTVWSYQQEHYRQHALL